MSVEMKQSLRDRRAKAMIAVRAVKLVARRFQRPRTRAKLDFLQFDEESRRAEELERDKRFAGSRRFKPKAKDMQCAHGRPSSHPAFRVENKKNDYERSIV